MLRPLLYHHNCDVSRLGISLFLDRHERDRQASEAAEAFRPGCGSGVNLGIQGGGLGSISARNTEGRAVKVSVLCAVRDEAHYIAEMMDSLLRQTLNAWELLVVDDGSSDGTAEIVRAYGSEDRRIQLISSGHVIGKVAAYNLAFERSVGEVVTLLAGDDILPPESLQVRYAGVSSIGTDKRVLATYKLRTFSADRRFDGMLLPRGQGTSLSGGVVGLSRALARLVFPIPSQLPSEDTWLSEVALGLADARAEGQDTVLRYRIHEG
ncbi:MAG TPA: glycosyltransferase family 2 protein, partial [Candidatus Hydrogenedentes bacterium]|nr:glycosyltransferase family 2 protein [Candidatus Hydrogenedentota bacterium]